LIYFFQIHKFGNVKAKISLFVIILMAINKN
jgi:hypothetical protein